MMKVKKGKQANEMKSYTNMHMGGMKMEKLRV